MMVFNLVVSRTQNISTTTDGQINTTTTTTTIPPPFRPIRSQRRTTDHIPIPRSFLNVNLSEVRKSITAAAVQRRPTVHVKRMDDKESDRRDTDEESDKDSNHDTKSKEERFETKSIKLQPALTIPLKNAIIQELEPIDRQAAAATASRLQDNLGLDDSGIGGEIVYEDELGGELSDWMPPPPPPPPHELSFRRRPFSFPQSFSSPSSSPSALSSLFQPGTSARLFGDDFALFLVILTIAGFFGLMLAMFMPFTFLMQQQLPVGGYPVGIGGGGLGIGGIGGYPGAGVQSGYGGYPPYGRRRRRRKRSPVTGGHKLLEENYDLQSNFIRIMVGMDKFMNDLINQKSNG